MAAAAVSRASRMLVWTTVLALIVSVLAVLSPSAARAADEAGATPAPSATASVTDETAEPDAPALSPGDPVSSSSSPVATPSADDAIETAPTPEIVVEPTRIPDPAVGPTATPEPTDEPAREPAPTKSESARDAASDGAVPGAIGGTVDASAAAEPVATWVYAYPESEQWNSTASAVAAEDGSYTLSDLPAGRYKVQFVPDGQRLLPQWWNAAADFASAEAVEVTAGTTTDQIDATLVPGASVSGRISSPSGAAAEGQATVRVYDAAGDGWNAVASSSVSTDGTYVVGPLAAGAYKLQFDSDAPNVRDEWWEDAPDFASASTLEIAAGEERTGIDATLAAAASISGQVTYPADATDIGSVQVYAYASEGTGGLAVASTSVAEDGSYTVGGLPAGSYKLQFDTWGSLLPEWWDDEPDFASADAVAVADGEARTGVDATLATGASLSGTVVYPEGTDTSSGGTYVYAYPTTSEWNYVASGVVAEDGTYVVRGLPAGSYKVRFDATGLGVQDEWWNDTADFASATTVTLTDGQARGGLDATLATGASIAGTVTFPAGATPSAGTTSVVVRSTASPSVAPTYGYVNADGTYLVEGLAPGAYKVEIATFGTGALGEWWNDKSDFASADLITLAAGQNSTGMDVTLARALAVSGTVTSAGGGAVSGATVNLVRDLGGSSYWTSTLTDASGRYSFDGVVPGSYKVFFRAPDSSDLLDEWWADAADMSSAKTLTLTTGQAPPTVDAALSAGASLSGTVTTADGAGVGSAVIQLYTRAKTTGGGWITMGTTTADTSGAYSFRGLTPGTYTLGFAAASRSPHREWWNDKRTLATATAIPLAAGERLADLDAALPAPSTVSGIVSYGPSVPAGGASVLAYDRAGLVLATTTTDEQGRYDLTGLPAGDVTVGASAGGGTVFAGGASVLAGATFAAARGGSAHTLDVTLSGTTVSGTVTASGSSEAFTDGSVVLISTSGLASEGVGIDVNGSYTVHGVVPGVYAALVVPRGVEFTPTWADDTIAAEKVRYVVVGASPVTKDLSVQRSATLSGSVAPGSGWTSVTLYRWSGAGYSWVTSQSVQPGESLFRFDGLAPGSYTITVGGYYLGQTVDATRATRVDLVAGGTRELGLVDTRPVGGSLSGTVSTVGAPWTSVRAYDAAGGIHYATMNGSTYSFERLAAGAYTVLATAAGHASSWYGGATAATAKKVAVTTGGLTTADITLAKNNATITGLVTRAAGGAPIAGAWVTIAEGTLPGSSIQPVRTGADGRYTLPDTAYAGGAYTIDVWAEGYRTATMTVVARAGAQTRDVALTANGALTGRVVDRATGAAVASLLVQAVPHDPQGEVQQAWTDADGRYDFDDLIPGAYALLLGEFDDGYLDGGYRGSYYAPEWLSDSATVAQSATITVSAGVKSTAPIGRVGAAGVISGRVNGIVAGGSEWLEAEVSVYVNGDYVGGVYTGTSGAPGGYSIVLKPGKYTVCAEVMEGTEHADKLKESCLEQVVTVAAGATRTGLDLTLTDTWPMVATTPRITGSAVVGKVLTASPGTWTPGARLTYQWLADGAPIPGATRAAFTLTNAQAGAKISVSVSGSLAEYTPATRTSAATAAVTGGTLTAPVPKVSGSAVVGQKLTATPGSWTSGTTLKYQWFSNGTAISKATASTYTVTSAVAGTKITVRVTGSKTGFTTVAKTSAATATVLRVLAKSTPTISGSVVVGQKLTAKTGSWTGGTTFSYQWYANDAAISKATASTFVLTSAQQGKTITVRVTGKKSGYVSAATTSAASAAVLGALTAPVPKITGSAVVGQTLRASAGTWTSGTTLTYQWYAGGAAIAGATGTSHVLTSSQHGKAITVRVTGKRSGFASAAKTSAATTTVQAVLKKSTPTISGSAKVGQRLTAKPGSWTSGTALSYQWYANGAAISKATGSSFVLTSAQQGKTITVRVTGKKSGYVTAAATSPATARVAGPPTRFAASSNGECPASAPVKGNADSGIYHVPGGRYYARTKAEECFTTPAAASAAGYRASQA